MLSVLQATIESKTSSVTTHFKKLTTGNNVFHILQFLHQTLNMSTLLLDDALKPATPLIAPLVSGVAYEFLLAFHSNYVPILHRL